MFTTLRPGVLTHARVNKDLRREYRWNQLHSAALHEAQQLQDFSQWNGRVVLCSERVTSFCSDQNLDPIMLRLPVVLRFLMIMLFAQILMIIYCMGFAQHRPCRGNKKFYPGNASQQSEEGSAAPGSFLTHHEVHLNCFGVMLRIDSRNALPSGQRGRITVPAKHFFLRNFAAAWDGHCKNAP